MADERGESARLETELVARAERLAEEYLNDARGTASGIIEQAKDRVRAREDHEVQLARAAGERAYKQRVQAAALQFDAELDRLRWTLIQEVICMLRERLTRFVEDEAAYLSVLRCCLGSAASSIDRPELVVEMNARDLERFESRFGELARAGAPRTRIELSRKPIDCVGGIVVRSADERMRVDDTFEERIRRLDLRLEQTIMDRLFGALGEKGASLG